MIGAANGRVQQPDEAEDRLDEREVAIVRAKGPPDAAADKIGIAQADAAHHQRHQGFETQDTDGEPPGPSRPFGKADGRQQIAGSGDCRQAGTQIIGDAYLEEQLVDGAKAGG